MGDLSTYHLIIIFSATIIISYFFNIYSKKSGIPAVLMLIAFGVVISGGLSLFKVAVPNLSGVLGVLGTVGLILIVLEAALDLKLLKEKIGIILSDDLPFNDKEIEKFSDYQKVSLGEKWLQGHSCVAITQYVLDKL